MMRTLQLMQDQIAVGSSEAHAGQRGLLAIFDERFLRLANDVWQDKRNVHAAVVYALSGGSPQILRKLLGPRLVSPEDLPLVEGALAYVEGREEEAKRALLPINAAALPATMGAQLALVQSALLVRAQPEKSMELLDLVRLQAPGTLLEEAALRRQVFVASQMQDDAKFEFLVRNYLRRYRHSVYAGNFRQRLASVLSRIDFAATVDRFSRIAVILHDLEPSARRDLYLLAARTSVEQGRLKSALLTAEAALQLSEGNEESTTRAKLYHAAAIVVSPQSLDAGLRELEAIDRSVLSVADGQLLNSAMAMAQQIRRLPDGVTDVKAADGIAAATQAPEQLSAVTKAQAALRRVDKLIKN
jgi:chemotaxis protein MotC